MSLAAAVLLVLVLPTVAGAVLLAGATGSTSCPDDRAHAVPADVLLARGVACGLAAWLLGSGLLARFAALTGPWSSGWTGLAAAVSLGVLLGPGRPLAAPVLRTAGRRLAEVGGVAAVVALPIAWTIVRVSWSPLGSTPWYYYGLARQVAAAGSVPATSVEFGVATPFLDDYHLFTTGTAMWLRQHPGGPLAVTSAVALLAILLLALGASALTASLGAPPRVALLAVPVVLATGIAPIRLVAYRPEGFALGVTLLMAALGVDWLRRRDGRSLVAAALLAAVLSQVHGIAALTGGVVVVAAALVGLLRGRDLEQLRRAGVAVAALLGAVVVSGLVFREASGTVHAGGLVDQGGLADPTWEFFRAARDYGSSLPPSNAQMVTSTLRELYDPELRWWAVPVLLLALVGLYRARRSALTRSTLAVALVSLVGLALVASVFMLGWQGYVPRRTGASRLVLEMSLLVPPVLAVALGGLGPRAGTGPPPRRRTTLVPLVLLLVLSAVGLRLTTVDADYFRAQAPTRGQLAAWRAIPVRPGEVVLANGYTEGFIPIVTGGRGLVDGRAPYTFGSLLHRADHLFRAAQAFYSDPQQHWDFLAAHHVTWVVLGYPSTFSLATGNVWHHDISGPRLAACPGLDRVGGAHGLVVYRVVDDSAAGC